METMTNATINREKKTKGTLWLLNWDILHSFIISIRLRFPLRNCVLVHQAQKSISSIWTLEQDFFLYPLFVSLAILLQLPVSFHSIPFIQSYWKSGLIFTIQNMHSHSQSSRQIKTKDIKCERNEECKNMRLGKKCAIKKRKWNWKELPRIYNRNFTYTQPAS